jgi:GNAT superfamily N-acetyltransferase
MIVVRSATALDVPAIVAIHCADILAWKRWDEDGLARLADYAELSPYERWLNGGPWLDESTFAPYLSHLAADGAGGIALVAEVDGQVRAVAEAVMGEEQPYGRCLDIGIIYTMRGHGGQGLGSALMQALGEHARGAGCDNLLVTHAEARGFYARHGFRHAETWRRVRLPARAGHTRYAATDWTATGYEAVRGWSMPVGRYQCSRQEWQRLQPGAEPDFEAWRGLRLERRRLEVRGTGAWLALEEAPREPGVADVHLWLPPHSRSVHRQMLAAIRDLAAGAGLHELMFFVSEATLADFEAGWHADGYRQELWLRPVGGAGNRHMQG